MQAIFDTLINSYIETEVGISANFLSHTLSSHLRQNLLALYNNHQLLCAGTGNEQQVLHNKSVRSDKIYWLDTRHKNEHENTFLQLIDRFILYLNATCYAGITGYEFHYSMYEKGSFYGKHIDQFKNDKNRAFSMIMYLNKHWQLEDGGELCIYQNMQHQNISPVNGKCVFFKSSHLIHEVLPTNQPRLSITGWLKTG